LLFVEKIQPVTDVSDVIKEYLPLLEEMYNVLSNRNAQLDQNTKQRFAKIQNNCENLLQRRGTMIKDIITIRRTEHSHHYLLEDANFSIDTIKELIRQGEKDAESALAERNG
jgi:NTE family protein